MKTLISSIAFQDEAGNALSNGSLIFSLPSGVYLISSGGGQVIGQSFIINLDATGKITGTVQIWASDEINPQTPYSVVLCQQPNGAQAVGTATWFIGGVSPIDLSLMTQTSTGISYSGAVLLNPTAQQNINGQTLNMEGASVGFSAAASTTSDSFLSRLGNGIIGIGTAIGNALGILSVSTVKQPAASSFAILDALGVSHLFISSSSPYTNTFVNGNGAGSVFLGSTAKASVADTTGKITTAGGLALQTASQTLPATVSNDASGGINLTSNGGKTVNIGNSSGTITTAGGIALQTTSQTLPATIANDSAGGLLLTVNGGGQVQLGNGGTLFVGSSSQRGQKVEFFGATSGTTDIQASAVAGATTLTLPAATDTLVGKSTTDTLTNKTLTSPVINTGVSQGSGLKHQRFGASCTTPAVAGASCISTYTWTNAFADANYTVTCQGEANVGSTAAVFVSSHTATQVVVGVVTFGAIAASFNGINCIAIHD